MVLPEVLSAYGDCVHQRLADLARLVDVGGATDNDRQLAEQFIEAIIAMRLELQLPLKPQGLQASDVADIVKEALAEAGGLYPVPRYMSADEIGLIVNRLLPA
jgi:alcohol dehydrogenase